MTREQGRDTNLEKAAQCLGKLSKIATGLEKTIEAMALKRVTLEEKMIRQEFHSIASRLYSASSLIHAGLANLPVLESFDIEPAFIDKISSLADEMLEVFSEFHKIVDYDWNFLEQYYEHEFLARLRYSHKFAEKLESILSEHERITLPQS